jgi:threonylcarbamoyladenosine tRNA methylthiotransferase MtaB
VSSRVALTTFGCKANQADTLALKDAVATAAGDDVAFAGPREHSGLDVVVVNTCTVTHTADADARQLIRKYRRASPDARIVVTGCYAQTDRDALEAMPEVDHIVGNIDKSAIPAMVARLLRGEEPTPAFERPGHRDWNPTLRDAASIRTLRAGRSRPFVKVQDGCDYVCSFCIIPQARGASRSLPMDDVVATMQQYAQLGAQEVVLTGIHLGHWGRDLKPRRRFSEMLLELLERTDVPRYRISSLEPNEVDNEVIALAANHPRVCPHLHVPLQSGDDGILAAMRRVYRTPMYATKNQRFADAIPLGAWGIDVMVGFPGEDDAAFEQTYRYLRGLQLTYLHVFPYSPRRNTPAAGMPNQVDPRVKRERVTRLTALSNERRSLHATRSIGSQGHVVVEDRRVDGRLRGFTESYVPVLFEGPDSLYNSLVAVEITDAQGINGIGHRL